MIQIHMRIMMKWMIFKRAVKLAKQDTIKTKIKYIRNFNALQ